MTDPFLGAVYELAAPVSQSSTIETWVSDALLQADLHGAVPPFGARGIAVSGSSVIVGNFSTSSLIRVAIGSDGKAGAVVKQKALVGSPRSQNVWSANGSYAVESQVSRSSRSSSAARRRIRCSRSGSIASKLTECEFRSSPVATRRASRYASRPAW